jgi:hypothetical protein
MKIVNILKRIIQAIAKFLHFAYASEITIAAIGVWVNLFESKVIGLMLIAWAVVLFVVNSQSRLKQSKTN